MPIARDLPEKHPQVAPFSGVRGDRDSVWKPEIPELNKKFVYMADIYQKERRKQRMCGR
jgi:hypothetical protein